MSQLHKALESLRPTTWSDVPIDHLADYLHDVFAQAELIINSVPPIPGGDAFEHATRSRKDATGASKATEMLNSGARPPPAYHEHQDLAKGWGKPMKLSAKDNPLGVSIHKMAGHDRHGAWFTRRSVHEGLGFTKWKKAMQKEFPESLAHQTGPGAGAVRGIGGDRKLERCDVEGVGRAEVYELSSAFPPPTSPRDFVTLLLTSDNALTEKSAIHVEGGHKAIPRHWMVVSIPCEHPDAPPRSGLVRGTYESVEIIREIPLNPPKSRSTPDLLNTGRPNVDGRPRSTTSGEHLSPKVSADDPELNPVEWIMVTRSDPGGGIPRFLVERGTPPSIAADTVKFLDWACARDEHCSNDQPTEKKQEDIDDHGRRGSYTSMNSRLVAGVERTTSRSSVPRISTESNESLPDYAADQQEQQPGNGLLGSVGNAIRSYTPNAVQQQLPGMFSPPPEKELAEDSDEDSTDSSSIDSFASAEPYYTAHTHDGAGDSTPTDEQTGKDRPPSSQFSHKSQDSLNDPTQSQTGLASADKELAKIDAKKRVLEGKLAASKEKREREEQKAQAKSVEEAEKQRTRHEREVQKRQERHDKEMRKLELRAEKEARKAEAKKRKELDKDTLTKTQRERDEFKSRAEVWEEENRIHRAQMGDLQRENSKLVAKMGGIEHGQSALLQVREEMKEENRLHKRGISVGSTGSKESFGVRGRAVEKSELVEG